MTATTLETAVETEVKRIAALPYTREVMMNSDGSWIARIVEFDGCIVEGDTALEALEALETDVAGWIEDRLEDGDALPNPMTVENYSGKFVVRVAKSLHRDLARCADREGVSLNAFVTTHLAKAVC